MIVWATGLMIVAHIVLTRTQFGNLVFAQAVTLRRLAMWVCRSIRVKIADVHVTEFWARVFATWR